MTLLHILFLCTGGFVCLFLQLLVISSLREDQLRAAPVASALFIIFSLLWFGSYVVFSPPDTVMIAALIAVVFPAILFFCPIGHNRTLKITNPGQRFDERDVVFSREDYEPGTERYDTYYSSRPENKAIDDKLRRLPELLQPGGHYYDSVVSSRIDRIFDEIEELTTKVDGNAATPRQQVKPTEMTNIIKQKVLKLGASDVGVATLNPAFVYSHVGRGPEQWGKPIVNNHKYAIVFTMEMDYEAVDAAPGLPITEESANQYLLGARLSIELAEHIRSLGYPARAHIAGSNYQVILPAVAHDAGLGELGRIGYLISPKLGARIRLGAVTTDLPLLPNRPISFGVQDFCAKCLKCATNCPSAAIPDCGETTVRGVDKWPLNPEKCLHYWRAAGSDCGICMKVCPYSHPPTLVHNLVRAGIRRSSFARTVSVWGDDLFYGRKAFIP